jgi:hypothetical protein
MMCARFTVVIGRAKSSVPIGFSDILGLNGYLVVKLPRHAMAPWQIPFKIEGRWLGFERFSINSQGAKFI